MRSATQKRERRNAELETLRQLAKSSTIFEFTHNDPPPDRYQLVFKGKGYSRSGHSTIEVETVTRHEVELRLPFTYPDRPPEVRWQSPLFHPNVSSGGYIQLDDVGIDWHPDMTLVVICEKLWDLARFAHVDVEKATNYQAERFWEEQMEREAEGGGAPPRPADNRVLRNRGSLPQSNIVKYSARGLLAPRGSEPQASRPEDPEDVLFIGEDTPTPPLTRRSRTPRRGVGREPDGDEGIFFIGDE